MDDLVKTLSRYVFFNMMIFNSAIPLLIGYIAIFVKGSEEMVPLLAIGLFVINISYMLMVSNALAKIYRMDVPQVTIKNS